MITFTVAGQPQGKGRPRIGKVGTHARMFTPQKTVAYEGLIAYAAQQAMAGAPMLDAPLNVNLFINCQVPASWSQKKQRQALAGEFFPTTKPDIDNVVKAVFDGLNGVLWRDDVLVIDCMIVKRYAPQPGVKVEVWPIDEPQEPLIETIGKGGRIAA